MRRLACALGINAIVACTSLEGLSGPGAPDASDAREEAPSPPPVEAGPDALVDAAPPPADAAVEEADAGPLALFDDEFDRDLSRWTIADDAGAWTIGNGEAVQGAAGSSEIVVIG